MIKVEPCKGCGGVLLVDRFMGVTVRCDPTPLDAQAAGQALVGGQTLYRVYAVGGRPSSFGSASPAVLGALRTEPSERPMVVPAHRCTKNGYTAPVRPQEAAKASTVQGATANPPAAPGTPSWGHSAPDPASTVANPASSTVRDAPKRGPRCSGCGQPCADGTYASIELGDIVVWASHVDDCGKRN